VQVSLRRHLSRDSIAHANADSDTHARHVEQRGRHRAIEWVPSAVDVSASAEFRLQADDLSLTKGVYYVGAGEAERCVSGTEFESACAAVNWMRRWNIAKMQRKVKVPTGTPGSKDGLLTKDSKVRRKRQDPACEEFVVNLSPWQMSFVNGELNLWKGGDVKAEERKALLLSLLGKLRPALITRFQEVTLRDVIASYVHLDSNKIHFGIVHSRVSAKNELLGEKTIPTVGPWTTAQSRIAKLGLVDAADHRLRENLEKFHKRHGESTRPLDVELHELLDSEFEAVVTTMGADAVKRFDTAKEHYGTWKIANRQQSVVRSSTSATVAHETLRLLLPLLPPQLRTAIAITRTGVQAFQVVNAFLNVAQPIDAPQHFQKPQPEKTK
jgi:hypothetical protein